MERLVVSQNLRMKGSIQEILVHRSTYLHDHRHTWDRHCVATVVDQGHQHAPLADHNISSVAAVDLGAPSCDSADRDVL